MMHQHLLKELQRVSRRYRRLFDASALSAIWLVCAIVGACLLASGWRSGWTSAWAAPSLAIVALVLSGGVLWAGAMLTRDPRWVARKIEAKHPELGSVLLAALEQEPGLPDGQFGFLQSTVIREALGHHQRTNWLRDIPARRMLAVQLLGLIAFSAMLLVFGALVSQARQTVRSTGSSAVDDASMADARYQVEIAPGDTEIERGTSLVVTARFADDVPDAATLITVNDDGERTDLPMSLSLSDPMFGTRIAGIQTDLTYAIQYADQVTREYNVKVFEFPSLRRADAELVFPEYTGLEPKRVEDTRRVTAVEGTKLTLTCRLNKAVESARLVGDDGENATLIPTTDDPTMVSVTQVMGSSRRYRLELADAQGRANKEPPDFVLNVTPNRRPDLKVKLPAKDLRVSPLEELETQASVWDDFGVVDYGISYTLPGQPMQELSLGSVTAHNQRREFEHLIAFEALQAKPDQLLAYHFWAEDIGPDGQPRRTMGDMYFAEVRHFEEIFRQGEQQPGGQGEQQSSGQGQQQGGENGRQAEELAELQKQIINATWTVIRRETKTPLSDLYATDVGELQAGQNQALQQVSELAEQLEDALSKQHAAEVVKHMTNAIRQLTDAAQASSSDALLPALATEQEAYQALLKLRAREHEVVRSNQQQSQQSQSGSASGQQSRAQQQLEQLELDDEQNRYETQQQANQLRGQDQEQRETLQVLNRLRELARRQADLNKRLKELQSALDAAETEQQRKEIQEQLKRLREQQQQMLRDMDELAERMEQPQNQERMSQARQDLEQTRENIRQTTEALKEGQVSQAVASGTRAERELEEMREEFRRSAANRFADQVEQLRDEARELDEDEAELSRQLSELDAPRPPSPGLRDADNREEVRDAVRRQQEALRELLQRMQQTVEEAEEAEPLMAGQLYDSIREARQQHIEDALDATGQLMDRGLDDQARMAESQAADGIEQLRQGVEQAADSVLGDEQEALRRAQQTLDELARQLNDEMRRVTGETEPDDAQRASKGQQRPGQPPSSDREGQQRDGQRPTGQPEQGQQQGSQQRAGQQPEGQQQQDQSQEAQQPGTNPGGQPAGTPASGEPSDRRSDSEQPSETQTRPDQPGQLSQAQPQREGGRNQAASGPSGLERFRQPAGPMTGDFVPWADQLRDVEEMIDDPEMRADTARIRDAARAIRREMHRNFQGPNWDLVRELVAEPLNELRDRVAEELLRRQSDETLVPIDRDPVPPEFADQVRRYYEQLGSGQ